MKIEDIIKSIQKFVSAKRKLRSTTEVNAKKHSVYILRGGNQAYFGSGDRQTGVTLDIRTC